MKNIFSYKFLLFLGLILAVQSCKIREDYSRPTNIIDEKLFRTDQISTDSSGLGSVSWKEIFTDVLLQRHIYEALENNLDIRIALQNINAAESYLKQSKAAYQPTLEIGPEYTFQTPSLNGIQSFASRRYLNQFELGAGLGWEADLWGKLKAQEKAQLAELLGTVAAHQNVKSDLIASIATAYFQLLAYDEQKKIINETISVRKKNLETTKALKQAGTLTEVAVQQSEALVYNAESLLVNIDVQTEILENTISLLKGVFPQNIQRSSLDSQNFSLNTNLGYPAYLLHNRPDVKMAEGDLINAFELKNAARAQFYPTFRITGSGGVQSIDIDHLFSVNSLFGNIVGGLLQPVLNKRQIRTNYEVSVANKEKAYLNFRKTVLTAGKEVSDALKTYTAQDQFITLKEKELQAYQKSVHYSQELVNYGMANYLEVLNASVNALNAELNISNAKFTKMQAGIELYRALGGGWK